MQCTLCTIWVLPELEFDARCEFFLGTKGVRVVRVQKWGVEELFSSRNSLCFFFFFLNTLLQLPVSIIIHYSFLSLVNNQPLSPTSELSFSVTCIPFTTPCPSPSDWLLACHPFNVLYRVPPCEMLNTWDALLSDAVLPLSTLLNMLNSSATITTMVLFSPNLVRLR